MKRCIDFLTAAVILLLVAPIFAIVAIVILIETGEPVFYRRRCVGLKGRPFDMLRFRTMVDSTAHPTPEECFTPVGRFVRNYSLDEIPMLLNVLRGEMSLVGPRPTEVGVVDLADADWQRITSVRPGIISYSILSLARDFNASDQHTRKRLEIAYLARRSLRFDFTMFRKGLRALIISRGNHKARGEQVEL